MLPKNTVKLDKDGEEGAEAHRRPGGERRRQEVYANFDIPDEILEELSEE